MDRAVLVAYAVNEPKQLDIRRNELRERLRGGFAPTAPPKFTREEMNAAVARLMAKKWKTVNTMPS